MPAGLVLRADPGLRIRDNGRVLIGGAPLKILRLSDRGAAFAAGWFEATPVADSAAARKLARVLVDAGMAHPVPKPCEPTGITIIVPVRDDEAGLERCLAAARRAALTTPVVVVDDGSVDREAIATVARSHGARLVRREVSGGPGAARASGLVEVDTPLVAFLDADVEPAPEWLRCLIGHFDDPAIVGVAPRVRSRSGSTLLQRYEREHSPLDLGAAAAGVGPGRTVAYVPTAALVVRRSALEAVGGFDEGLRFGEDVDVVWRLVSAGGVVRYDPAVEVVHEPRPGWSAWARQRLGYGSSAAPLGIRHGRKVAPARCSRWSAVSWGALAGGHPLIGIGVAAGSSLALVEKVGVIPESGREAARLSVKGHLHAGSGLARALLRVWWPIAIVATISSRRSRPVIAAATVLPAAMDWIGGRRPTDPVRSVGLRMIDDLVYGAGVWTGMARERTMVPIVPDLVGWPDSKSSAEATTVADG